MVSRNKNSGLAMAEWPLEVRRLWQRQFAAGSPFAIDNDKVLSPVTIQGRGYTLGIFLAFLKKSNPEFLALQNWSRWDATLIEAFVIELRHCCRETTVVLHLERLFFILRKICPEQDFHWIYRIARRIALRAPRRAHPVISSPQLYGIGLEGLSTAQADETEARVVGHAIAFRDALLISVLAEAPMRRGSLASLRLSDLTKVGDAWEVNARAEHSKTRKSAEYELSHDVSAAIDVYLEDIRPRFPGSDEHDGLWASTRRCPLLRTSIGRIVGNYTLSSLGVRVSPHGFRRAAGAFIAQVDSENIHVVRDLLGHHDFRITEQHYLPAAQTRRAGRELARVLGSVMTST